MITNTHPHQPQPAITLSRDLVLKLQVGDTVVSRKLSIDEALGLIGILNFGVREIVYHANLKTTEISTRSGS